MRAWNVLRMPLALRIAVLSLVVAGSAFGCGPASSGSNTSPSAVHSSVLAKGTPPPPQPGPFLVDVSWTSNQAGWALAAVECSGQEMCARLYKTADGGQHWQRLPDPPGCLTAACSQGLSTPASISKITFATSSTGFLYGSGFYVTVDGGSTWTQVPSSPVEDVEGSGGVVYRLTYDHTGCPGPCQRTLEVAAAGSSAWRRLLSVPPNPGNTTAAAQVIVQASDLYVPMYGNQAGGAGSAKTVIFRSLDGGVTWQQLPDPCGQAEVNEYDAVAFASAQNGFLASLCRPRPASGGEFVVTSIDAGQSWGSRHVVPAPVGLIAAASATVLAVASPPVSGSGPYTYRLLASSDGGATWPISISDPEVLAVNAPGTALLAFQDGKAGRWIGDAAAIWTTDDGAKHWIRRQFP
jgi:photosystem II stability/assembly factor-like uncharacterized protein